MNGPRRHSSRVSRPPRGVYCASHALVKTLTSQDIGIAANALCMRGGKNIDLETEDEISVLMDYAIYDVVRDGRNVVDRRSRKVGSYTSPCDASVRKVLPELTSSIRIDRYRCKRALFPGHKCARLPRITPTGLVFRQDCDR